MAEQPQPSSSSSGSTEQAVVHTIYTIGHSKRPIEQLVSMLQEHGVRLLADIRTVPRSRTNPQFNRATLDEQLPRSWGLQYEWLGKELGGLRKAVKDSDTNAGWDNASFRGYADYMQTPAFAAGLNQLRALSAARGPLAMMCAEASHFSCHRRMVADALVARGAGVLHITTLGKPAVPHVLTEFAKLTEGSHAIQYPAYSHERGPAKGRKKRGPGKAAVARGRQKTRKRGTAGKGPLDAFVTRRAGGQQGRSTGGHDGGGGGGTAATGGAAAPGSAPPAHSVRTRLAAKREREAAAGFAELQLRQQASIPVAKRRRSSAATSARNTCGK